jgi:hypothetical protein
MRDFAAPGALTPYVSPLRDAALSPASRLLAANLLQRFPEWERFAAIHDPGGRLDLDVPAPSPGRRHRLVIRERPEGSFEVLYEHDVASARVVADFLFTPDAPREDAAETADFVAGIVAEEILIVVEAPWYFGVNHGRFIPRKAFFARADRARFTVVSWRGTFDQRRILPVP